LASFGAFIIKEIQLFYQPMNLGKKTKIVCTIGPATESAEMLEKLVNAGMNVMRLNFSHGDFAEHQNRVDNLHAVMKKTGKTVAILQDLGGPKIRIGSFKDEKGIILKSGATFTLTTNEAEKLTGDETRVFVNYPNLPKEVHVGGTIMIRDGRIRLEITKIKGNDVVGKVIVGGPLSNKKGVNLPDAELTISALTAKDKKDLEFGLKNKVDFFALSFVRKADDIHELRAILKKAKSDAHIIAKIETPQALENLDAIIEAADGLMVARGDLAIEIPAEEVPMAQKEMIAACIDAGKPVITATQMLESMIKSPIPTRAEVSDVANAIMDGTDAIMLSEETTLGEYPVEAVTMMSKIAARVEADACSCENTVEHIEDHGVTDVISQAAVRAAHDADARFIVALTRSGRTARMVARYRPTEHTIVISDSAKHLNKLALSYGCQPISAPTFKTVEEAMAVVREVAAKNKLAKKGDHVVLVGGFPFGSSKDTNLVLVETL
jgi:pyruvate kinase